MLPFTPQPNDALIRSAPSGDWLFFHRPRQVLVARQVAEVLPLIRQLESDLVSEDEFAAGFISYEAAPGFDQALPVRPGGTLPLAWFGLYPPPQTIPALLTCQTGEAYRLTSAWAPSVTRQEYQAAIREIKDYIARGDTYQVNYTYRLQAAFEGDPLAYFIDLARAQEALYAAFIHTSDFTICSASPELFFSLQGERLSSRPMKGTAARGLTLAQDQERSAWLRNSAKNQAENVMIVDMVRNDIGKIARIGSVHVPELFSVEKYPTVWQMVSTVVGETDAGLGEIFQALFPPASITGAPKRRTMQIISGLETSPRKVYTGCIGFIAPQRRAQFNVAIRTVLIDHASGRAEYGTGGGVTWDSTAQDEYEECQTKARILTARQPDFSLLETMRWTPGDGYFLLDLHLNRLGDSASYFSFPFDLAAVHRHLSELSDSFDCHAKKVRLLLDRRGRITTQVEILPPQTDVKPLRVCFARTPVDLASPFLYHKTTHRQLYEEALRGSAPGTCPPWDDVILWNDRGEVTEACNANIVVDIGGTHYTPPVHCGLLPGTYRAWLLAQDQVKEKVILREDLTRNQPIYLINSVRMQRAALLAV
jgi:para-aminobenzoate synthetase/4-amino-4-deoxychorismate lyase